VPLAALTAEDLGRFAVPGALVVGLRGPGLRREEDGTFSLHVAGDAGDQGREAQEELPGGLDGVIYEVIYEASVMCLYKSLGETQCHLRTLMERMRIRFPELEHVDHQWVRYGWDPARTGELDFFTADSD